MTADQFRRLALSFDGAEEHAHGGHPDFRVRKKIFATLGYPSREFAMIKLTADQQELFMKLDPGAFVAVKGGWGRRGATNVVLKNAKTKLTREALLAAWKNIAG